jgi:hypothetical protein
MLTIIKKKIVILKKNCYIVKAKFHPSRYAQLLLLYYIKYELTLYLSHYMTFKSTGSQLMFI